MTTLTTILTGFHDLVGFIPWEETAGADPAGLGLPNPDPATPPGASQFETVVGWIKWIALTVCIIGIIIGGALMAIKSRSGEGGEQLGRIGMALAGVVIISGAFALVTALMGG